MGGVRLVWDGKDAQRPRLRLPLQVVETVNASRADRGTLSFATESEDGWQNKLIWGDNLHVLHSLAEDFAGRVDLIYIDPPFDSRQDYNVGARGEGRRRLRVPAGPGHRRRHRQATGPSGGSSAIGSPGRAVDRSCSS